MRVVLVAEFGWMDGVKLAERPDRVPAAGRSGSAARRWPV